MRSLLAPAAAAALLVLGGCGDDDANNPGAPEAPQPDADAIPTNLTDPAAVVDSHALAMERMDLDAYTALLEATSTAPAEAGFRFYPLDIDRAQFPWLPDDHWDAETELGMIGNMFDPNFSGAEPPAESITFLRTVFRNESVGEGLQELEMSAVITVLTGPDQGFSSDTRFIMLLARQPDGFWRIRELREVHRQGRGAAMASVESSSWGQIKGLYH